MIIFFLGESSMSTFFWKIVVFDGGQIMTMQVAVSISRIFIRLFRKNPVLEKIVIKRTPGGPGIDRPLAPMFENQAESAGFLQLAYLCVDQRKLSIRWCP